MFTTKTLRGSILFIGSLILAFIGVSLFITGVGLFLDSFFMILGLIAALIAFYTLIV